MNRPAVFLDRDGTIIEERHYLATPDLVQLVPGADCALRALAASGFALVVITNQSGIARGVYTEEDFHAVQERLNEILRVRGIVLDAVYHCPHHPDFTGSCDCRKPRTGLFRQAQRDLQIDLSRSAFVGDRWTDVAPAIELGGLGVLVRTGHGAEESGRLEAPAIIAADLGEAASMILTRTAQRRQESAGESEKPA